ncbi:MAG: hypothetical protein WCY26_07830 [Thiohalobacteraceae bacterium]
MSEMNTANETRFENVACPFCGLCCDDLTLTARGCRVDVVANGCELSRRGFGAPLPPATALARQATIQGDTCTLDEAIAYAADLLRQSRLPLFAGLGTDVNGARALTRMADRIGAILDHMNSDAMATNLAAVQDNGWITTTLTEVRNRVDTLVVFGAGIGSGLPRFYERCFSNVDTLFDNSTANRRLYLIGDEPLPAGVDPSQVVRIPSAPQNLVNVATTLRAILNGNTDRLTPTDGIPMADLQQLADRLRQSVYSVFTWVAGDLDFPHADLTIQTICNLSRDLNKKTRSAALPLGGNNGDHTFAQVCTWQTGYATRVNLATGHPEYDLHRYSAARLLAAKHVDLLLWVSAYAADRLPPAGELPTIVLGRASMQLDRDPKVFIPVATPGIDHEGHIYRCDGVATLPLKKLRSCDLPDVHTVVSRITEML